MVRRSLSESASVLDPLEGVSPSGTIVTGARRDRVAAEFEPVLATASELVQAHSALDSLYLYDRVIKLAVSPIPPTPAPPEA